MQEGDGAELGVARSTGAGAAKRGADGRAAACGAHARQRGTNGSKMRSRSAGVMPTPVSHVDADHAAFIAHHQPVRALVRELHRVAEQVRQDLRDLACVRLHVQGIRRDLDVEVQSLLSRRGLQAPCAASRMIECRSTRFIVDDDLFLASMDVISSRSSISRRRWLEHCCTRCRLVRCFR